MTLPGEDPGAAIPHEIQPVLARIASGWYDDQNMRGRGGGTPDSSYDSSHKCCPWKYKREKNETRMKAGVTPAVKKYYTDMANKLIPLATFAGGITLATQFIIQCPKTRLQALLALASQLFLATPLALVPVYLLLYGTQDDEVVFYESYRHALVSTQFVVSGIMLSAAFILLGTAIYAAQEHDKFIGVFGLALIGLLLLLGIAVGILKMEIWNWFRCSREKSDGASSNNSRKKKTNRWTWPSVLLGILIALVQLTVVFLLLGFGGKAASRAEQQYGCNTTSRVGTTSNSGRLEHF